MIVLAQMVLMTTLRFLQNSTILAEKYQQELQLAEIAKNAHEMGQLDHFQGELGSGKFQLKHRNLCRIN